MAELYCFIRPQHHLGGLQRVEETSKRLPGDSVRVLGFSALDVVTVEHGLAAGSVPPSAALSSGAVARSHSVPVPVTGAEFHPQVIRQRIALHSPVNIVIIYCMTDISKTTLAG